jgi:hypothetical protein
MFNCCSLFYQKPVYFDTLKPRTRSSAVALPSSLPQHVLCPSFAAKQLAKESKPSPVFPNVNVNMLKEAWDNVIGAAFEINQHKPRSRNTNGTTKLKLKFSDEEKQVYTYKRRGGCILHRAQYLTVQFIDMHALCSKNDRYDLMSSLAVYTYSKHRFRDHSKELKKWIELLFELLNEEVNRLIMNSIRSSCKFL